MASRFLNGAANETRTRYLHLGKVALYQMSYGRNQNVFDCTTKQRLVKPEFSKTQPAASA